MEHLRGPFDFMTVQTGGEHDRDSAAHQGAPGTGRGRWTRRRWVRNQAAAGGAAAPGA